MISEESWDTEAWSNDAENRALCNKSERSDNPLTSQIYYVCWCNYVCIRVDILHIPNL